MMRLCEICGNRPARYICQECGRLSCEFCFIPERWLCIECYKKLAYPPQAFITTKEIKMNLPLKLFLAGFIITFIGAIILMLSSVYTVSTQGGFIWIFPLPPFAFGTTQKEGLLAIITVAFSIIFLTIFTLIIYKILKA